MRGELPLQLRSAGSDRNVIATSLRGTLYEVSIMCLEIQWPVYVVRIRSHRRNSLDLVDTIVAASKRSANSYRASIVAKISSRIAAKIILPSSAQLSSCNHQRSGAALELLVDLR